MKKIIVVDNRDSFVYNIIELLRQTENIEVEIVYDNNSTNIESINLNSYNGLILSPGAGLPEEYPLMTQILNDDAIKIPILGVCLGMQAMIIATGGKLKQLPFPKHGHASPLKFTGITSEILKDIPDNIFVGRYHSWVLDENHLPSTWNIIAYDEDNNIMITERTDKNWIGVQFHPESIITETGIHMIQNWINSLE